MKILWYNKNIDVLLNELKNHSISKKITKFIHAVRLSVGKIMEQVLWKQKI